eukprot:1670274-Amphidinium_carterae.1
MANKDAEGAVARALKQEPQRAARGASRVVRNCVTYELNPEQQLQIKKQTADKPSYDIFDIISYM